MVSTIKTATTVVLFALILSFLFTPVYQHTSDWHVFYAVATNAPLPAPYHNPFWTSWVLYPLRWFESESGYSFLMALTLVVLVIYGKKVSGSYLPGVLTVLSVPFLRTVIHGQIEVLPLLGFLLLSPVLILTKPQSAIGALAAVRWYYWPIVAGLLVVVYFSIDTAGMNITNQNINIFPFGLIVGVPLGLLSFLKRDKYLGAIATPFVAPYVIMHSLLVPLFALNVRFRYLGLALFLGQWYLIIALKLF